MRVIIRLSLDDDAGNQLRTKVHAALSRHGFRRTSSKTATYESDAANEYILANAMTEVWPIFRDHLEEGSGRLDHFWMYVDQGAPHRFSFENPPPMS